MFRIRSRSRSPRVHPTAYVAPNAVLSGDVTVGPHSAILFGAVLTAEGGAIAVGERCVIMETAVLRGAPGAPLRIGDRTLVGPRSHLTGCTVEEGSFLATGSTVFNGAVIGAGSEVRINCVVHVGSRLAPGATLPIGWIAVGNPARILPPGDHEEIWAIQRSMEFDRTVFRRPRGTPQGEIIGAYAESLCRHREDETLADPPAAG